MGRIALFCLSAIVLRFALLQPSTLAQEKRLKEQLVGAWTLLSCDRTTANGAKQPYCLNSNGILILDASGRYAHMIVSRDRPKLPTVSRSEIPAEQFKAVAEGFVANFGTWSVNELDRTITRHYEGALLPNFEGRDFTMSITVVGDQLTLVDPNPPADFQQGRVVTVYRRLK